LLMQHQPFSWVDAGGPKLRMLIEGTGNSTVVFDAGGGGSLELWGRVPSEVSKFARTVSYDRAGNGLSDKATTPREARHIATELHTALQNAKLLPPYIFVGHSVGGPYVRVFAGLYPGEVAGMVLVDPSQEGTFEWDQQQTGVALPDECTPDSERGCTAATLRQAQESAVPSSIPVFLIHVMYPWGPAPFSSRGRDEIARSSASRTEARLRFHKEWIQRIPGAELIITEKSSHGLINFEEPDLVIHTIQKAIERSSRR
jgi:pimeloyl-ACP methyl ester carboxylesterase